MDLTRSTVWLAKNSSEEAESIDEIISNLPYTEEGEVKCQQLYQKKFQLLVQCAKYYLQAVNEVSQENLKCSLIILANAASAEAAKIKQLLEQSNGKALQKANENKKKEIKFEADLSMYCERILIQAHRNHNAKRPQIRMKPTTPQEIVRDLLSLEGKIEELGIKRKKSDKAGKDSLNRSVHLSSQLGESFMVLGGDKLLPEKQSAHRKTDKSKDLNLSVMDFASVMSKPTSEPICEEGQLTVSSNSSDDADIRIPVETTHHTKAKTTTKPHHAIPISAEQHESINRLLKTVETLRDENHRLEEENEQILSEMARFREDFKLKFTELRFFLKNQALLPPQPPPVVPAPEEPKPQPPAPVRTNPASLQAPNENNVKADKKEDTSSPKPSSSQPADKFQSRQAEMEKLVSGLMERVYDAKEQLKLKDKKIKEYEALIQELQKGKNSSPSSSPLTVPHSPEKSRASSESSAEPISPTQQQQQQLQQSALRRPIIPNPAPLTRHNRHPSTSTLQSLQPHLNTNNPRMN